MLRRNPGESEFHQAVREVLDGGDAHFVNDRGAVWDFACDIALPSAIQNELDECDARALISHGCQIVAEGANMLCTPEAIKLLSNASVVFAPGQAANAGGVDTSALEMRQNASRDSWTFEHTEQRLADIMSGIHTRCLILARLSVW